MGEERLLEEIHKRLNAKVTKFHQDKSLGQFEDNTTRMHATKLLADMHGKTKTESSLFGETGPPARIQIEYINEAEDEDNAKSQD